MNPVAVGHGSGRGGGGQDGWIRLPSRAAGALTGENALPTPPVGHRRHASDNL